MKLSDKSPFDGKPFEIRVHEFAVQMIRWLSHVRQTTQIVPENSEERDAIRWASKEGDEAALGVYSLLTQKEKAIQRQRSLQRVMKKQTEKLAELSDEIHATLEKEKVAMEKRADEREQVINGRLQTITDTHSSTTKLMTSQIDDLGEEIEQRDDKLRKADQEIAKQGAEIRKLFASNKHLRRRCKELQDDIDSHICSVQ